MFEQLWQKTQRLNWSLIWIVLLLLGYGFLLLIAAGGGLFEPYAAGQLPKLILGVLVMWLVAILPLPFLYRLAPFIYGASLLLLVLVAMMGTQGMGATRWLSFGGLVLQPSEIAKVALVLALAWFYQQIPTMGMHSMRNILLPIIAILVPVFLVFKQPDLGTALTLLCVGGALMFVAGVHRNLFIGTGILGCVSVPVAWLFVLKDYQKQRVLTFLNPEQDPLGAGYHVIQSKIAIGSAGFWGKGYLQGSQSQLAFLPEKHTDFIFALLVEDLGVFGALCLIAGYVLMLSIMVRIALRNQNRFCQLAIMGVVTVIFLHAAVNMAMVMGLLPVVGIPLPLISYGGSALLMVFIGVGIALNADLNRDVVLSRGEGVRWRRF